jgi:glycosyltransferase involved in cell wall biosynthesis
LRVAATTRREKRFGAGAGICAKGGNDMISTDLSAISFAAAPEPRPVEFVILIPVYKHSVLIVEAVESALAQQIDGELRVVIVNDGCPHPETHHACFCLSQTDRRIVYLNKPNGGPSDARNFAIDYVVHEFTALKALFFLDADNRLSPNALAAGWTLLSKHQDVGWVYPNITSFEVEWAGDYSIPYSKLLHVVHDNLCDTGSLIRAELLQKLRFNASARSGFEDWDFWLSAVASGYKGLCSSTFGFEYRNRAESRFKEVSRDRSSVTNYMRDRYKKVFTPRVLLGFEHIESPRMCFFDPSDLSINYFTDPARVWKTMAIDEFARVYWASRLEPEKFHVPKILVWGRANFLKELKDARILYNLLWHIERQLKHHHFVVVSQTQDRGGVKFSFRQVSAETPLAHRSTLIAARRDIFDSCVDSADLGWLRSLASETPGPDAVELTIASPSRIDHHSADPHAAVHAIMLTVSALQNNSYRRAFDMGWNWRCKMFPPIHDYPRLLEDYFGSETLSACSLPPQRANVAFVVPFASYGGSEKVGYAAAMELRKQGYSTHLFVIGGKGVTLIPEFAEAFDSFNLIGEDAPSLWGGEKSGRGTEFATAEESSARVALLLGLLATMDVVVNCQSAPLNAAIGELKKIGIMTISYIHLFDQSSLQREVGHPFLGLLFEHAYDLFLLCSHNLRHRLHALGMPTDKMLTVENAPSFRVPAEALRRIREERQKPPARLRALYIGRMDRQKGMERIVGLVERCAGLDVDVAFRFVGSSLVEDDLPLHQREALHRANVRFEPPIFDTARLTTAFAQADVLILPSRWEGAPLVILEAQQIGCIPIATDVGAVPELIHDGVDGFLVPDRDDLSVIHDFATRLQTLITNPELRRSLALNAMDRLESVRWSSAFAPLLARLEQRFPQNDAERPAAGAPPRSP